MIDPSRKFALGLVGILSVAAMQIFAAPSVQATDLAETIYVAGSLALYGLTKGYQAAPALMLGLGLLTAIPLLTLIGRAAHFLNRPNDATRRYRGARSDGPITGEVAAAPGHAFVEVLGPQTARYAIVRDMLRFGREEDNDIRIPNKAVHRYHAAIHREAGSDWWITDLTGIDGNGVIVNGRQITDALLRDGDVIELGPGQFRFHARFGVF